MCVYVYVCVTQMDDVKTVSRDAFVQASIQSAAIREYVKMALLPPPRPDDDADEAEVR